MEELNFKLAFDAAKKVIDNEVARVYENKTNNSCDWLARDIKNCLITGKLYDAYIGVDSTPNGPLVVEFTIKLGDLFPAGQTFEKEVEVINDMLAGGATCTVKLLGKTTLDKSSLLRVRMVHNGLFRA